MTSDFNNLKKMLVFKDYIDSIDNESNKKTFQEILEFVISEFPQLEPTIKWNQPIFTDHGTYIIGFSVTKNHVNIAPERAGMVFFDEIIRKRNIHFTKMLLQMKWTETIDFDLIRKIIKYNIADKKQVTSFWR